MSLSFNGTTSYAKAAARVPFGAALTLGGWVYANAQAPSQTSNVVAAQTDWSTANAVVLFWDHGTGDLRARVGAGGAEADVAVPRLAPGAWHHLAVRYDGAHVFLFVDGAVTGTPAALSGTVNDTAAMEFHFGNYGAGSNATGSFAGDLQDWKAYGAALTDAQVAGWAGAQDPAALGAPAPLAAWPLAGAASPEPDSTGHGHDLTLANTAAGPARPDYALAAPSPAAGKVGFHSGPFAVTPINTAGATVTVTPTLAPFGGGASSPLSPVVLTFPAGSKAPQTFSLTPASPGVITCAATNSAGLADPAPVTYTALASGQRQDNFRRADSAAGLGTPSDGESAWVTLSGQWGVASNEGYNVSGGYPDAAVLETGVSDLTVELTFGATNFGGRALGVVVRAADAQNYFAVQAGDGALGVRKFQGGAVTALLDVGIRSWVAGDRLTVKVLRDSWTFLQSGTPVGSVTDGFNQSATLHGLYANNGGVSPGTSPPTRFDLFTTAETAATTFAITGTDSGAVGRASDPLAIAPDGVYSGSITLTPSGGGIAQPLTFTWDDESAARTFSLAPTQSGTVTLNSTNTGGLAAPSPAPTFVAVAPGNRADTFARAAGTDSPTTLGKPTDNGPGWINLKGTFGTSGGYAYCSSGGEYDAAALECGSADGTVSATIHALANEVGLVARATDGLNYWRAWAVPSRLDLYKVVNGTPSLVGRKYGPVLAGDTLGLRCHADVVQLLHNGAVTLAWSQDLFHATATRWGVGAFRDTGSRLSSWSFANEDFPATGYTLTGPQSVPVGQPSNPFVVTPDGVYGGSVTLTPSGGGLTAADAVVVSWGTSADLLPRTAVFAARQADPNFRVSATANPPLGTDQSLTSPAVAVAATRADTLLRADSTPPGVPTDGGPPWLPVAGAWSVAGHALSDARAGPNDLLTLPCAAGDAAVSVTFAVVPVTGFDAGPAVRVVDPNNFYYLDASNGGLFLRRVQNGSVATLNSWYYHLQAGDVVTLRCRGADFSASVNGVFQFLVTDPAPFGQAATRHGVWLGGQYYPDLRLGAVRVRPGDAALRYTLAGPTGLARGVASGNFTVALAEGTTADGSVTVTPADGGAGGTFAPASVALTTAAPAATFAYTAARTGAVTISAANDSGLADPASLGYVVTGAASTYLLTAPAPGRCVAGHPSGAFTAALKPGESVAAPVTVTPADGGAGGTFAPAAVTLAANTPGASATFAYTPPATPGVHTVAASSGGALADPAGAAFAGVAAATTYTIAGPPSGDCGAPWAFQNPVPPDFTHQTLRNTFTLALDPAASLVNPVTVTLADDTGRGEFFPGGQAGSWPDPAGPVPDSAGPDLRGFGRVVSGVPLVNNQVTLSRDNPSVTVDYVSHDWGQRAVRGASGGPLADPAPAPFLAKIQVGSSGTLGYLRLHGSTSGPPPGVNQSLDLGGFDLFTPGGPGNPDGDSWWAELGADVSTRPAHPQSATVLKGITRGNDPASTGVGLLFDYPGYPPTNGGQSLSNFPVNAVPGGFPESPVVALVYGSPDLQVGGTVPLFPSQSMENWIGDNYSGGSQPTAPADYTGGNDNHTPIFTRDEATGGVAECCDYQSPWTGDRGASWGVVSGSRVRAGVKRYNGPQSSDASGLPLGCLLLRYDELAHGHALGHPVRVDIPITALWVSWPALATASPFGGGPDLYVMAAAPAAAGATTLSVHANPGLTLEAGDRLEFAGGTAATLAAPFAGGSALTVLPLAGAVAAGDVAPAMAVPAMGTRLRLKPSAYAAPPAGLTAVGLAIWEGLYRRGTIVADSAGTGAQLQLCGVNDSRWAPADLAALRSVPHSAFDALAVPGRLGISIPPTWPAGTPLPVDARDQVVDNNYGVDTWLEWTSTALGSGGWNAAGGVPDWQRSGFDSAPSFSQAHPGPFVVRFTPTLTGPHVLRISAQDSGGNRWTPAAPRLLTVVPANSGPVALALTGPGRGAAGQASGDFTVTPSAAFDGTVTPTDGGAGGTFAPASLTFTTASAAPRTFTYTPAAAGTAQVGVTNTAGLAVGPALPYTNGVAAAPAPPPAGATAYTLTGPAARAGAVGAASGAFTVAPNGAYTGTVTPHTTGAGTFSPASLAFAGSSAPLTFTYTPTAAGTVQVTTTASPALGTDPPGVSYTAAAPGGPRHLFLRSDPRWLILQVG